MAQVASFLPSSHHSVVSIDVCTVSGYSFFLFKMCVVYNLLLYYIIQHTAVYYIKVLICVSIGNVGSVSAGKTLT